MTPEDELKYKAAIELLPEVVKVYQFYRNKNRTWIVSLKTNTKEHTTRSLRTLLVQTDLEPLDFNRIVTLPERKCESCGKIYTPQAQIQKFCSVECRPASTHWRDKGKYLQYGITKDDYDRMFAEQDGKCYICKQVPKRMVIDHCHTSGKVRHLLCVRCNSCLGWFETFREEAEEYVKPLLKD